ncbi:MAG TPA: response regulator [Chitinophagaceae bacterium]
MKVPIQTAMIIDDDIDLSVLLTSLLEERKIHTLAVHSLAEAEECLAHMTPSIIFLDNSFPDGLGINFIKNIKSSDAEIKIVMMTADSGVWIEEKAKNEGANYFLKKPFSLQLVNKVLDSLNFKRAQA